VARGGDDVGSLSKGGVSICKNCKTGNWFTNETHLPKSVEKSSTRGRSVLAADSFQMFADLLQKVGCVWLRISVLSPYFSGHFLNSVKVNEHATHACRGQERCVACNHLQMAVVRCHHPTFSPPTSSGHGKQRMCPQYIANTSNTSSRA